jgi:hypothetical protein
MPSHRIDEICSLNKKNEMTAIKTYIKLPRGYIKLKSKIERAPNHKKVPQP